MSITLQVCADCGRVNYPQREVCRNCLGERLEPTESSGTGVLLAWTTLHASGESFFRDRLPWRIGSVHLDLGAVAIVHLGDGVNEIGQPVELSAEPIGGRMAFSARAPESS